VLFRYIKIIAKKEHMLEENKPRVYAIIKRQLSRESLARVQSHEVYIQAEKTRDPLSLWKIVIAVHLLNTRELDVQVAKRRAQEAFSQCRMMFYENLAQFKRRFELRLKIYESIWKDCDVMDDKTAAEYFIEKLDRDRYGTIQLNYRNKVYEKQDTVQEVFEFINQLSVPNKGTRPVFHQQSRGGRGRNGRGGRNYNGRGEGAGTSNQSDQKPRVGPSKERPCIRCGSASH
jgi:hypothetical protein